MSDQHDDRFVGQCDGTAQPVIAEELAVVFGQRALPSDVSFVVDGNEVPVKNVGGISFPADIDTWEELMVVSDLHSRVLLFDAENNLLANLGYDEQWTETVLDGMKIRQQPDRWQPGRFIHPHDACFDQDGNIIVTEWVEAGRVTMLKWI